MTEKELLDMHHTDIEKAPTLLKYIMRMSDRTHADDLVFAQMKDGAIHVMDVSPMVPEMNPEAVVSYCRTLDKHPLTVNVAFLFNLGQSIEHVDLIHQFFSDQNVFQPIIDGHATTLIALKTPTEYFYAVKQDITDWQAVKHVPKEPD